MKNESIHLHANFDRKQIKQKSVKIFLVFFLCYWVFSTWSETIRLYILDWASNTVLNTLVTRPSCNMLHMYYLPAQSGHSGIYPQCLSHTVISVIAGPDKQKLHVLYTAIQLLWGRHDSIKMKRSHCSSLKHMDTYSPPMAPVEVERRGKGEQ